MNIPHEDAEQKVIEEWLAWQPYLDPGDVFSIPNQALWGPGANKARILTKVGASDIVIAAPNKYHHSGWCELKRDRRVFQKTNKPGNKPWPGVSDAQLDFLHRRGLQGCAVNVSYGADQAIDFISRYFADEKFLYTGKFKR